MLAIKEHIISQLQREILLLQGFKPANARDNDAGLDLIKHAFPNSVFPTGAIHEFFCNGIEKSSASYGFIAAIVSSLMKKGGVTIWISSSKTIFPPALKSFGIQPDKIIFLDVKKETEKLWTIEEALKCEGVASVVGQINEISFTESRRLQLAVEQTKVTGFLLRQNPKNLSTACVTRWKITPLATGKTDVPGMSFPRWNVELLKVRNGKPGCWKMEWKAGKLQLIQQQVFIETKQQRKIV